MTRTPKQRLSDADDQLLDWSLSAARHSPRLYRAEENAKTPIALPGDRFNAEAQNNALRAELQRLLGRGTRERNAA